jgi:hypothetical protein
MSRKASKIPKFTGQLAEPIKMLRPHLVIIEGGEAQTMTDRERQADTNRVLDDLLTRRLEKLPALLRHYGVKTGEKFGGLGQGTLLFLIVRMACDFIPGFQTVDEAARRIGRPRKHDPEYLKQLITLVDLIKKMGLATTDEEACAIFAETTEDPSLGSPRRKSAREKRARSLANLLSAARAGAKRKANKALH